jgi:hypothetical protein
LALPPTALLFVALGQRSLGFNKGTSVRLLLLKNFGQQATALLSPSAFAF